MDAAIDELQTFELSTELDADAARAGKLLESAWAFLDQLPPRSERTEDARRTGRAVVDGITSLSWRFYREHRRALYGRLTANATEPVRVDELVWHAAETWPGLLPTRDDVAAEATRMQADKDGREIPQGLFVSQMLSDSEIGYHLVTSMLAPTEAARAKLPELVARGTVDLGAARVSVENEVGTISFSHPRFLNAEDDETLGPFETAVDLILLHPDVRLGVLRGEPVEHPKYSGRRIFSAGINLTRLYHGDVSYLFYLVRDLGAVHKLYRGLMLERSPPDEPETTLEKPWMAVVDGFAIGGGCQLLLVVDHVLAEKGAYFNLPARKEGIIPGAANLRLPRYVGEGAAKDAILFGRTFSVDEPDARSIVHEVHPTNAIDDAVARAAAAAVDSGLVSAAGNRRALRVQSEPIDTFRSYMATYSREQAFCHSSQQLIDNLERHWNKTSRRL